MSHYESLTDIEKYTFEQDEICCAFHLCIFLMSLGPRSCSTWQDLLETDTGGAYVTQVIPGVAANESWT